MPQHTKRIRDPVHGLIVFDMNDEVDRTAWKLIDAPEFQRLRRVKQLGFSELVFPGATHNRFSHSIGVFHVARQLMNEAKPILMAAGKWNDSRRRVALLAALLHDIGHGPFSHAFELAEQERLKEKRGAYRHHEAWTADIINSREGRIRAIIREEQGADGALADDIATLLTASTPLDIYAAVVSSSFDADRLDYLQRDKLMTGSGAGGIDFHWLKDNLRVATVRGETEGSGDSPLEVETFCFTEKAQQAAESFLLARYHLFSQVYYHKTTRGFERLLTAFLQRIAELVTKDNALVSGLPAAHPLLVYYSADKPTLQQYLKLDDAIVWAALDAACEASDEHLTILARRLRDRKPMKPIEINLEPNQARQGVAEED